MNCSGRQDMNLASVLLDQVSLEGLDGITLPALATRILTVPSPCAIFRGAEDATPVEPLLQMSWDVIRAKAGQGISIYKMQDDRDELVIFNRYDHLDPDLGMVVEPDYVPVDPYPHCLIDEGSVKGSCSTFKTRENVTGEAKQIRSVDEVMHKYGRQKFVIVASQDWRAKAILGPKYNPLVADSLSAMQWCMLERIGRARSLGEVTQGKLSLQALGEAPKTLFYHRKYLLRLGLITKQIHYQKTKLQNYQGSLFHLPRFYIQRRSKAQVLIHSLVCLIKSRPPEFFVPCDTAREELGLGSCLKKLVKHADFVRFLRIENVLYRTAFPDATEAEWKARKKAADDPLDPKEKQVRIIRLLDNEIDPESIWNDVKEETFDDDESDDKGDDLTSEGLLDRGRQMLDRTLMHQAYQYLVSEGARGVTQLKFSKYLGITKLEARTVCRNLQRRNLVMTVLNDRGRQRVTVLVAKHLAHLNKNSTDVLRERQKLDSLFNEVKPAAMKDESTMEVDKSPNRKPTLTEDASKDPLVEVSASADVLRQTLKSAGAGPVRDDLTSKNYEKNKLADADPSKFTGRQLKRANKIIELVRQCRVIDDPTKVLKAIQESEAREGLDMKMDKKSLLRLLVKLSQEGQIKNLFVTLQLSGKSKRLHFVCEPDIDEEHPVVQSAVEQAKLRLTVRSASEAPKLAADPLDSVYDKLQQQMAGAGGEESPSKQVATYVRRYGLQPKFVRMRELHQILFYLTRGYAGVLQGDQQAAVQALGKLCGPQFDDRLAKELEAIEIYYTESLDWKMFIPPLPKLEDLDDGWCLMCDVLFRLPLSLFVKLVNIPTEVAGLDDFLSHPIRQHYLVRHLPTSIRTKLLSRRKYIFTVHEVAQRLCFMGLLQFGPQKLKEKDQVLLYVNKRTMLVDTRNCSPSYHQLKDSDKGTLPETLYTFSHLEDVTRYWFQVYTVCMETPLGVLSASAGVEVTLVKSEKKPEMVEALSARTGTEAEAADDGFLPGDGLGAAGFDSSLFAHLKRNWSWNGKQGHRQLISKADTPAAEAAKKSNPDSKVKVTQELLERKGKRRMIVKRKADEEEAATKTIESIPFKMRDSTSNQEVKTRILKPRQAPNINRRPYYDKKDQEALKLMRKLRVDWTAQEDSFLLLCKVAGAYLCKRSRTQMVNYTLVRDLLHDRMPQSHNKTSRACQRRINYMIKNQTTMDNVLLYLAEIQQDEKILKDFPLPEPGTLRREENESRIQRDFEALVNVLLDKYQNNSGEGCNSLKLPSSIERLREEFNIVHPLSPTLNETEFSETGELSDIQCSVLNALVTSSLCSSSDKVSWSFQLFKIYQQYPDSLLRKVMNDLRTNKMVSIKKNFNKSHIRGRNYMPLSNSPYQLSVTFSHKLLSRYQYDIFQQSWQLTKQILKASAHGVGTEVVVGHEGGYAATIVGLMALDRLAFATQVPEQLVVLDPKLSAVDQQYVRIVQRYKELLRSSGYVDQDDILEADENAGKSKRRQPKDATQVTVRNLFTKDGNKKHAGAAKKRKQSTKSSADDQVVVAKKSRPPSLAPVSDQITFMESSDSISQASDERCSNQVAKSASRIALYMMREDSAKNSGGSNDEGPVQHSHDFFVISSCRIEVGLKNLDKDEGDCDADATFPINVDNEIVNVPRKMLPGSVDTATTILNRHGLDVNGRVNNTTNKKKDVFLPKTGVSLEEHFEKLPGLSVKQREETGKVLDFISQSKDKGVTGKELKGLRVGGVEQRLKELLATKAVVRTGIVSVKFLASTMATPWMLTSFRLTRIRDKERMQTVSKGPAMTTLCMDGEEGPKEEQFHPKRKRPRRLSTTKTQENEEKVDDKPCKRKRRGSGAEKQEDDTTSNIERPSSVAEAASRVDWDHAEQVCFLIRPWLRVDGTLNRRVFDRLLGAVLGHSMQKPGQTVEDICARFSPALQPAHTSELIDILNELGCIGVMALRKPDGGRVGLFSPAPEMKLEEPTLLDEAGELVVEAAVDAVIRLGQFIGDKQYTVDFVCQCPCHPDRRL